MGARRWMVAAALLLAGCGVADGGVAASESPAVEPTVSEPTEPEPTATEAAESGGELPGDYAEIIADETDCGELQAIFDTADNAAAGAREDGNLGGEYGADAFTRVMVAADGRMREVGCYD